MITGHFGADFTAFNTAVEQAEVKLRGFETDSEKVERKLNALGNAFSGQRIIQDATLMTKAVNDLGGATSLTADEQKKVNATLTEAINKYTALGKEAPKDMQDLAAATQQTEEFTLDLVGTVQKTAIGYLALKAARAGYDFVMQTAAEASAMTQLSREVHIGAEELQTLAGAMREFGVNSETLGAGLYGLSRRIATGDDSVAAALHTMGMSLEQVRGLQGEDLFLAIERGLATLQGGLRDTTAAELFGSKMGAAMAGASDSIDQTLEHARRFNTVMKDDAREAFDKFGTELDRAKTNMGNMAANGLTPLVGAFNQLFETVERGGSKWGVFVALTKDLWNTYVEGKPHAENFNKLLEEHNVQTNAAAESTKRATDVNLDAVQALDARGQAAKFMGALELDAAKPLEEYQLRHLQRLTEIGQLTAENARGIGVSAQQLKVYQEEIAKEAAAVDATTQAWNKQQTAIQQIDKDQAAMHNATLQNQKRVQEELVKTSEKFKEQMNAAVVAEFDALVKLNAEWGLTATGAIPKATDAMGRYNAEITRLTALKEAGYPVTQQLELAELNLAKGLLEEATAAGGAQVTIVGLTAAEREHARVLEDTTTKTNDAAKAFENLHAVTIAFAPGVYEMTSYFDQATEAIDRYHHALYMGDPNAAPPPIMVGAGPQLPEPGYGGTRPTGSGIFFPNPTYQGGFTGPGSYFNQTVNVTQPLGTPNQIARAVGSSFNARLASQGYRAPES